MTASAYGRGLGAAGWVLGFALGGFFDGILLHQILQWHHLLSALDDGLVADPRAQVAADGLFHLLMYGFALMGLALLWRRRAAIVQPGAGHRLWSDALFGFALWHGVDAVLSHWLLGIHRIRMDTAQPLLWDLGWVALFGVGAALAGWAIRRRSDRGGGSAAGTLAAAVAVAGPLAALPPPGADMALALFSRQVGPAELAQLDADVVWSDSSGQLWLLRPAPGADLSGAGAVWVSRTLLPAACLNWTS